MKKYTIPKVFDLTGSVAGVCYEDKVSTYSELIDKVAKIANANNQAVLYFRGQNEDFMSKGVSSHSTLYPSILRGNLSAAEREKRLALLWDAERLLLEKWKLKSGTGDYYNRIKHWQVVRWAILQHYEVVDTPLLDVTQSLRIACAFAQMGCENEHCYIYVLALPYPTCRISMDSEEQVLNMRLQSICPNSAKRPFVQEAYLLGDDYFEEAAFSKPSKLNKMKYDFSRRLVAKFKVPSLISSSSFWDIDSAPADDFLYLKNDGMTEICKQIHQELFPDGAIKSVDSRITK